MKLADHKNFPEWLQETSVIKSSIDKQLLTTHFSIAEKIGQKSTAEELKNHLQKGINIATILLSLHSDNSSLAAALCYPIVRHCALTDTIISQTFTPNIAKLLIGVMRMSKLDHLSIENTHHSLAEPQADNIRKILLAIIDDIRVVPIKLSEHLVKLHAYRNKSSDEKKTIAKQTRNIYAPLANRLGIGQLKWQLEDFSFRYSNEEEYKNISKKLNMRRTERENYINNIKENLTNILKKNHLKQFEILGRPKHIYSIHKKIIKKNVDIKDIYDSLAIRILTSSIHDCYQALSLVHGTWSHLKKEFDDYIANPKPNGYKSIHTVITGPENTYIEVQIRTFDMDEEAELGVAAHWIYKEGHSAEQSYENKIATLRQMLDWQEDLTHENTDINYQEIFQDRIYVFTPNDDIIDLGKGATPLDFAYAVHTDIGHKCRGAKVNGALVPLSYTLRTGDRIEIITGKEKKPSRDWLNPRLSYLSASRSIQKVAHWFKQQNQKRYIKTGETLWEKHGASIGLTKNDLQKATNRHNLKTINDLLVALGSGNIGIKSLIHEMKQQTKKNRDDDLPKIQPSIKKNQPSSDINISEVSDILTQLARCCKPIPGDEILGYITKGYGVSIHKSDCKNMKTAKKNHAERILEVSWNNSGENQHYAVDLIIQADDRPGLVRDISTIIANEKIRIQSLNCYTIKNNDGKIIETTIEITNPEKLKQLMQLIKKLPGIHQVKRRNELDDN